MTPLGEAVFLGVRFDRVDEAGALAWVEEAVRAARFAYLVTPNVDHVVIFNEDHGEAWRADYRAAVASAGLCVNDSRILQRLARLSGLRLPVTPGSDLVRALVAHRQDKAGAIALIGGRTEEAEWLRRALPLQRILHYEPPMGVRDDRAAQEAIARFVEEADADIILFAIGAPQSEIVCHRIAERGHARGAGLCIGASVEFLSGAKQRAPGWMQKAGLEWAFRLASEPRRLAHRYLVRGPRVFLLWWNYRRHKAKAAST